MRCYDNGCEFTVSVSAREVYDFGRRWPCAGFEDRGLTFSFCKTSGDLTGSDEERHPRADGCAVLALAEGAQAYGARRLGLPMDVHDRRAARDARCTEGRL